MPGGGDDGRVEAIVALYVPRDFYLQDEGPEDVPIDVGPVVMGVSVSFCL